MVALTPSRTRTILKIRRLIMAQLAGYNYEPAKAEALVTQEMSSISKMSMRQLRKIARNL